MSAAPHLVSAGAMGRAFATDPELRLPDRPRLIPELLVAPAGDDGVLFAGAASTEVVRGRSARGLLPRLLPLLDGTRAIDAVAGDLPDVSRRDVHDAVALLFSRGLLEDGPLPDGVPRFPDLVSFLGRYNDVSRSNRSRVEAFRRLAAARVRVAGPSGCADVVGEQLASSGVPAPADGAAPGGDALSILISTGDAPLGDAAVATALRDSGAVFLVRLGAAEAHLGPLLVEGVSVCPQCVSAIHPHPGGSPEALHAELWLSLAAQQVVVVLARLASSIVHRGLHRCFVRADGEMGQEARLTPRMPGCVRCGIRGERWSPHDPRLLPWIYHVGSSMTRRSTLALKEHQAHYLAANVRLAGRPDEALHAESPFRLPEPVRIDGPMRWGPAADMAPATPLPLRQLATVLARAAGEVGQGVQRRRLAPTGGNLGSVRLWVLARQVEGLDRGAYLYEPRDHSLRLRGGFADERLAGALGSPTLPACVVVGAADLAKCARKYRAFAYRLVHFDAGVALAYVHLLSSALGLSVREYADFDLDLPRIFGVGRRWEFPLPTFALGLGGAADPRPLAPANYSTNVMPRMLNAAAPRPPSAGRPPGVTAPDEGPPPVVASLDDVLERRRAIRVFGPAPPAAAVLEALVTAAQRVGAAREAAGCAASFVHPLLLVAEDGPGFASGIYERAHGPTGPLARRAAFGRQVAPECTLQLSLAAAPAALVMVTDLRRSVGGRFARGYCEQAVHAGAAVAAAWLTATSHGLVGTAAGGVIPDGLRAVAGLDGFNECPLLGLHVGPPLERDDDG